MVYLFVLIAVATMEPASGRVSFQTISYHATSAECQHTLLDAEKKIDRNYVKLECQPIRAVK
jgi:hypothetical protein